MTYFPDLSPYVYASSISKSMDHPIVNIGWLDLAVPYSKGETSVIFHERLNEFCASGATVGHTYGIHICQFCEESPLVMEPKPKKRGVMGGSCEIRVIGKSVIYAAPSLIWHYVVDHQYKPPDEFIEAVLTGPGPDSDEHRRLVAQTGI